MKEDKRRPALQQAERVQKAIDDFQREFRGWGLQVTGKLYIDTDGRLAGFGLMNSAGKPQNLRGLANADHVIAVIEQATVEKRKESQRLRKANPGIFWGSSKYL